MTLLNKGLRLSPDQTQIQLNNRLFETAAGTVFVTLKPDAPTVNPGMSTYTVNLLDPGSNTAGYLKIAVKHLDILQSTAGYSFVITTLGNAPQTIETPKIGYDEEVTLGLSWDNGPISYAIARADSLFNSSPTNSLSPTTGVTPSVSGFTITSPPTTTDTFAAINDGQYAGFLNKVATYSTAMSNADLQRYVLDPANLPSTNRVLLLDATALNATNRFDASVAEVQSVTFGPAAASGVITVDGATTVVMAGDSAATVAEKVRASLADSTRFKPQLEKQKITFSANTAGTSFNVAGVAVTVGATDSAATIATTVKTALDGNAFITGNAGRSVQNNGDGSLTVTFNNADGDARPISVDSLATTIKASVDTIQTYSATGTGRKVSVSGSTLSIELNPADLNPLDLTVSTGTTGVAITRPGTVTNHTLESRSFVPSNFAFVGTPVGEVQRFLVTTGADADGGTFVVAPSSGSAFTAGTTTFASRATARTISETASAIATALKTANASNTNVADVVAVGDAVEIRYKAIASNVASVTFTDGAAPNATGTLGIVQTTQQYAQNLQGEAQTITFLSNPTTASNITVDRVTVAVATTDTASSIATKVQTALVQQGPEGEVQTITFTAGASAAGNINVNNTSVALLAADTTAAAVAAKVVSALNAVVGKNYTATQATDSVRVTFDVTAGDVPLMAGLTLPGVGAAAGVAAGSFSTTQEYNTGRYSTPEVQMITFLSAASSAGNINVNGVSVAVLQSDTPAAIAGKAVIALNAVGSRNYFAVQDGDSVRVTFNNIAGDVALMSALTLPAAGAAAGITATSFSTIQEYNANGIRATKVNSDGTLTIEFAAYEGNVNPIVFTGGTTGVTASISTTREANSVLATTSAYSGNVSNVGGSAPASNVIYTQLVSAESGIASKASKKVVFDVFVDQAALSRSPQIGTGYESVDFTLGYSTTDFSPASLNVELTPSTGGSPIFNASKAGEIVVRWLDTQSITNFSKPVARVTLNQVPSGGNFKDSLDLSFSNVSIDGVDFTDGTTYARSFVDSLSADRWDIKQKLVNGLDGTTPIGGQLVGFYGTPGVTGRQLELKFNNMKDASGSSFTLANTNKQVVLDVINSDVAGVRTMKFAIELPSNAANTTFTLSSAATTAGLKLATGAGAVNGVVGRTLFVTLDSTSNATGLARGATIGSFTTELSNARDITHEFGFVNGSISYTGTSSGTGAGKSIYLGYTATANDNSVLGLVKGEWLAKDMPRGEFNKFLVDTAPTNASRVITAADALQILKLSAGFDLDWRTSGSATPAGAFAAADMDGSGKVTSNDALIALRYATGVIPSSDPVKWKFYDSTTTDLSVEKTQLQALKTGMAVTNTSDVIDITPAVNADFFTRAILVGNLTNPALEV